MDIHANTIWSKSEEYLNPSRKKSSLISLYSASLIHVDKEELSTNGIKDPLEIRRRGRSKRNKRKIVSIAAEYAEIKGIIYTYLPTKNDKS